MPRQPAVGFGRVSLRFDAGAHGPSLVRPLKHLMNYIWQLFIISLVT